MIRKYTVKIVRRPNRQTLFITTILLDNGTWTVLTLNYEPSLATITEELK